VDRNDYIVEAIGCGVASSDTITTAGSTCLVLSGTVEGDPAAPPIGSIATIATHIQRRHRKAGLLRTGWHSGVTSRLQNDGFEDIFITGWRAIFSTA